MIAKLLSDALARVANSFIIDNKDSSDIATKLLPIYRHPHVITDRVCSEFLVKLSVITCCPL